MAKKEEKKEKSKEKEVKNTKKEQEPKNKSFDDKINDGMLNIFKKLKEIIIDICKDKKKRIIAIIVIILLIAILSVIGTLKNKSEEFEEIDTSDVTETKTEKKEKLKVNFVIEDALTREASEEEKLNTIDDIYKEITITGEVPTKRLSILAFTNDKIANYLATKAMADYVKVSLGDASAECSNYLSDSDKKAFSEHINEYRKKIYADEDEDYDLDDERYAATLFKYEYENLSSSTTLASSLNKCYENYIKNQNEGIDPNDNNYIEYYSELDKASSKIYNLSDYYKVFPSTLDKEKDFLEEVIEYNLEKEYKNSYYGEEYTSYPIRYVHLYPIEVDGKFQDIYVKVDYVSSDKAKDYKNILKKYQSKAEEYPKSHKEIDGTIKENLDEEGMVLYVPMSADEYDEEYDEEIDIKIILNSNIFGPDFLYAKKQLATNKITNNYEKAKKMGYKKYLKSKKSN